MYNRILIPIDGSQQADKALDSAIHLSKALANEVHLSILHVNPRLTLNVPAIGMDLEVALEEEGKDIIESAKAKLDQEGLAYAAITTGGDPATVICQMAQDEDIDLIVMGSRGVRLITEMLLGSVSHAVVQHAHCPVLLAK
jgi:nucleotide-binding universal stress UspA family protein